MSYKVVWYLLDDTITISDPAFLITIFIDGKKIKELGSHILLKDDLILGVTKVIKESKMQSGKCEVEVKQKEDNLTHETIVTFDFKDNKLKAI